MKCSGDVLLIHFPKVTGLGISSGTTCDDHVTASIQRAKTRNNVGTPPTHGIYQTTHRGVFAPGAEIAPTYSRRVTCGIMGGREIRTRTRTIENMDSTTKLLQSITQSGTVLQMNTSADHQET